MATIRQKTDRTVVLSGDRMLVYSEGVEQKLELPEAKKVEADENKDQGDGVKEDPRAGKNCALASAFSKSGKFFAVADDQKQLHVFRAGSQFELLSTRPVARRCTALTFTSTDDAVIASDRTGDVYRYSLTEPTADAELLLGHLSMVLDVVLTKDDEYIVTADRDEKIRVSHYPNAYNIHAFCLHHTEYVGQLLYLEDRDWLLSGSGDGTLAVWEVNGTNLYTTPAVEGSTAEGEEACPLTVRRMVYDDTLNLLVVIFNSSCLVQFYDLRVTDNTVGLHLEHTVTLACEPWDISLDASHTLWVLQPCESTPVVTYMCRRCADSALKVTAGSDDTSTSTIVKSLCSNWDFFQASVDYQSPCISLTKQRTNENVKHYLEKKEERVRSQLDKKPPPNKKQKTG